MKRGLFCISILCAMSLFVYGLTTGVAQTDAPLALRTHGLKINVDDMDKAIVFYCDKLGFEIESRQDYPREVFLKTSGRIKLSLRQVKKLQPPGPADTRVSFTLQVNDLDQAIASLTARGVEFLTPEKRKEGIGFSTAIKDPFGGRLSLIHVTVSNVPTFKEPKLYNFGFYIPEMDGARSFYAKQLGLVELTDRFLPLDLPLGHADKSFAFMLHYRSGETQAVRSGYPKVWSSHTVVFETPDLKAAAAALKQRGVKLLSEQGPVVFADPFGNVSELVEAATVTNQKPTQSETVKPQAPPPLPGAEGVQPFSNRVAWVYTGNTALAPKMLQAIEGAAQSFTRHFGSAPPLVAVFDGASLSAEQRNAITGGGAVWALPLPVSQMAEQVGGEEKAFGTLAHEIGHGWFVNALWAGTPGRTGLHYGGGAPDWLDEVAAILLENEMLTVNRRETLKRSLASSDASKLIKPLGELFTMKHPGLDPAQMQEIVKRMQEARARGEATSAINLKPDPQSQQAMMMFYAQCRGWLDYLFQKSPDPKVLRSITDTLKSGKSIDDWLAAEGKRYGLPETLPKLQADWEVWLKQL